MDICLVGIPTGAFAVASGFQLISPDTAQDISIHPLWAGPILSGLVCWWVARRHRGRTRAGWALLGGAAISWGLGNAAWPWLKFILHVEPFPSVADVGYLATVPLAAAGVLCFTTGSRRSALRTLLDGTLIGGSLLLISWALVLGPAFHSSSGTLLARTISLAYPVGDIVILSVVIFVWSRERIERSPMMLIAAALAAFSLADAGYAYLVAAGTYFAGHAIDMGWLSGFVLIGVAAFRSKTPASTRTENVARPHVVLPYVVAGIALIVGIVTQLERGEMSPFQLWGFVTLLLIVVLRQFFAVLENQSVTIDKLRSLDDMKTGILHAVSHELRTPLTAIRGSSEMLRDNAQDIDEPTKKSLTAMLVQNVDRLEGLLGGLLDLGRLSRGVLEPVRHAVDMNKLMAEVAESVSTDGHRIRVGGLPVTAHVDAAQVERIIENLFVNAVRHTPAGTDVWAEVSTSAGHVLISVEDAGPGIPESIRDVIFEPFVQSESSPAFGRGTGIGLSLVSQFAELHGGRAWVETGELGGALFKVELPDEKIYEVDEESDEKVDESQATPAA